LLRSNIKIITNSKPTSEQKAKKQKTRQLLAFCFLPKNQKAQKAKKLFTNPEDIY